MSAYAKVKADVKDRETLIRALGRMGYAREDLLLGRRNLEGYEGDRRSQKADVTIPRRLGSASNDIGFEERADGSWDMHLSQHDRTYGFSEAHGGDFAGAFRQAYALEALAAQAEARGWAWGEETVDEATGDVLVEMTSWD